jgi:hypothetical protein
VKTARSAFHHNPLQQKTVCPSGVVEQRTLIFVLFSFFVLFVVKPSIPITLSKPTKKAPDFHPELFHFTKL